MAIDDVADVASAVAASRPDAHVDATYDLTGPAAFTLAEAAELRHVRHRPRACAITPRRWTRPTRRARGYGAPDWQVEAWVSTYTAIAAGELAPVSGDVERVLGRPATSLEAVLRSQR